MCGLECKHTACSRSGRQEDLSPHHTSPIPHSSRVNIIYAVDPLLFFPAAPAMKEPILRFLPLLHSASLLPMFWTDEWNFFHFLLFFFFSETRNKLLQPPVAGVRGRQQRRSDGAVDCCKSQLDRTPITGVTNARAHKSLTAKKCLKSIPLDTYCH